MISYRVRGLALVHSIVSGSFAAVLFWLWTAAHFYVLRGNTLNLARYLVYSVVLVAAFGIDLLVSKVRGTDLLQLDAVGALRLTFRQTLTVFGVILLFLVASKDFTMSRFFLFSFVPVLYSVLLMLNRALPPVLVRFLFRSKRSERTLLVGSAAHSGPALSWCRRKAQYGVNVVGLLTNDTDGQSPHGVPVLGRISDLEQTIRAMNITQVISLGIPNSIARIAKIGELCDRYGIRLLAINDFHERFQRPLHFFQDGGLHFVSLREEPLECPFNRILKRSVDIALSLPVVLLVLPLVSLAVAILHRFQSPGPLFFRQVRSGINGRSFAIYKYRTMHVNHGCEAKQATRNDARVFNAGRLLRKLSIDELPQFINVLKGEMSVVGPRPHMPEHDEMFAKVAAAYNVRTLVKPGITGLAQVRGYRGEAVTPTDVVKRVEFDVYYLENWSVSMEWAIILKTAWQMIFPPRSAY